MLGRMDPAIIERKERNFQILLGFQKKGNNRRGKKGNISKNGSILFFFYYHGRIPVQ